MTVLMLTIPVERLTPAKDRSKCSHCHGPIPNDAPPLVLFSLGGRTMYVICWACEPDVIGVEDGPAPLNGVKKEFPT